MKLLPTNFVKLAAVSLVVLTTGCRPTIEFQSDFTTVAPGESVEFEWDIELAEGTTSSKVTLSTVGEVELEGTESIVIDESDEITLRVSTFVLGMPITAKETISVNVIEDNFVTWDFDDLSSEGWAKSYAFYDSENGVDGDSGVFCNPAVDETLLDSFSLDPTSPEINGLGNSLSFCFHNNERFVEEEIDDSVENEEKAVMAYTYRKVTESDDFELEDNTTYNIGFSIKYGIRLSSEECENIENNLDDVFQIVVGVSEDEPEEDTLDDGRIVSFKLEEFEDLNIDGVDGDNGVTAQQFTDLANSSSVDYLRIDPVVFDKDDVEAQSGDEKFNEELCEENIPFEAVFNNLSSNQLQYTTEDDAEMYLMVGLKSNLLNDEDVRQLDRDVVEFYIDTIKVLIEEVE